MRTVFSWDDTCSCYCNEFSMQLGATHIKPPSQNRTKKTKVQAKNATKKTGFNAREVAQMEAKQNAQDKPKADALKAYKRRCRQERAKAKKAVNKV